MGNIYYKGTSYGGSNEQLKLIDFNTWLKNNFATIEEKQEFINSFNQGNEIILEAEDNKIIIPFDNSYFLASAAVINENNSDLIYTEETETIDVPLDNGVTGYYGDFKNSIVVQGLRALSAPHNYSTVSYRQCALSSMIGCYARVGNLESLIDQIEDGFYFIAPNQYTYSNGDKAILSILKRLLSSGDIVKYVYSIFEWEYNNTKFLMRFEKNVQNAQGTIYQLLFTLAQDNEWKLYSNPSSPTSDEKICKINFTEEVDIAGVIPIIYEINYDWTDETQKIGYYTLVDDVPTAISTSTSELEYPKTVVKMYFMPIGLIKKEDGSYRTASFTPHGQAGNVYTANLNMQTASISTHFKTNKERDFSNALQVRRQPTNWKDYIKEHYGLE